MISDRQAKERELRKEQILSSALSVFQKNGIEKATMDEIAKEADFGKATLYYYFSSKEEIFTEQLNRGWKMVWESIEHVVHDHAKPKDSFINSLNIIGGLVRKDQVLFEFLFTAPKMLPEADNSTNLDWKKYQSNEILLPSMNYRNKIKRLKNFINLFLTEIILLSYQNHQIE